MTGIPTADASGRLSFSVVIPADFALGAHRLVITTAGQDPIEVGVTVVRPGALAATGSELPWALGLGGAFLLAAGAGALLIRKRRENAAS